MAHTYKHTTNLDAASTADKMNDLQHVAVLNQDRVPS
jgi:hypothetical protein